MEEKKEEKKKDEIEELVEGIQKLGRGEEKKEVEKEEEKKEVEKEEEKKEVEKEEGNEKSVHDKDLEYLASLIKEGKAKNVIIMSGAGVSTAAVCFFFSIFP